MIDCSSEILGFYKKHVRLTRDQVNQLADYRESNKTRLEKGLTNAGNPLPNRHINQGSYAMKTINQNPENDYDIDVGVVFKKDDLKGPKGADKTALEARKMVCDAVQDKRFKKAPEVRRNCVRVYYNEGYHVDMPVYRESLDENDKTVIQLASADWRDSDPEAVTKWFNQAVKDKSPDTDNGRQMRRVVRLIKFWCKSRGSWNMPTGFIVSKLVDECYQPVKDRDDEAFKRTLEAIRNRLVTNRDVYHPVILDERITDGKEAAMNEMKDRLDGALEDLSVLDDPQCNRQKAMKTWKKFFNQEYFEKSLKSANGLTAPAVVIAGREPEKPVERYGETRFG